VNAPRLDKGRVGGPSRRREAADRGEGSICKCIPPGEVGPWVEGGCEYEAQPLQVGLRVEVLIL